MACPLGGESRSRCCNGATRHVHDAIEHTAGVAESEGRKGTSGRSRQEADVDHRSIQPAVEILLSGSAQGFSNTPAIT